MPPCHLHGTNGRWGLAPRGTAVWGSGRVKSEVIITVICYNFKD